MNDFSRKVKVENNEYKVSCNNYERKDVICS